MSFSEKMTGLMNAVRSLGNSDAKMSVDDAISVLKAFKMLIGDPVTVDLSGHAVDTNTISHSSIIFEASIDNHNVGLEDAVNMYHLPTNKKWWYLITLYATSANALQLAIDDSATHMYMRSKVASVWNSWTKVGGVIRRLLKTTITAQMEVVA